MEEPRGKQRTPDNADSDSHSQPEWMQPIDKTLRFFRERPAKTAIFGVIALGVLFVGGFISDLPKRLLSSSGARTDGDYKATKDYELSVVDVAESARGPVWDISYSDQDEVVARIGGTAHLGGKDCRNVSVVCFWRLAQGFETNWHIARRRSGGNYLIATVDGPTAIAGNWQAFFGGIQCPKQYAGDVAVVLIAYTNEYLRQETYRWLGDENGWGFPELPSKGALAISPPRTFHTASVR
jgi:hypothetical protein